MFYQSSHVFENLRSELTEKLNYDLLLFRKIEKLNSLKFSFTVPFCFENVVEFPRTVSAFFDLEKFQLDMEWHRDYLKGFTSK